MHLRLLTFLGLFVAITACTGTKEKPKKKEGEANAQENSDCEAVTDHKIYGLTASLWMDAWEAIIADFHGVNTTTLVDAQLYRSFSRADLDAFLNHPLPQDIRIYFAQKNPLEPGQANVPDLVMVRATDCIDDLDAQVLLATWDPLTGLGSTELIDISVAQSYIENWKNSKTVDSRFIDVISYTFTGNAVQDVLNEGQSGVVEDLRFYFGVHASCEIDPNTTVQGHLMVDIIMGLAASTFDASQDYVDLARPCPKLCAPTSPLYQSAQ